MLGSPTASSLINKHATQMALILGLRDKLGGEVNGQPITLTQRSNEKILGMDLALGQIDNRVWVKIQVLTGWVLYIGPE